MRMKNRFCRMGETLLGVACLLSTCGVTYSCSDDYDLDETRPSFLGASIYDELKNRGNFTTVIRLIDDLGYRDVMSKTGSKTLFVAADSAFDTFFKTTTWTDGNGNRVDSYDKLSVAQKRLLLNGAQLNNAYVLEMLTTIQGPTKNLCLRQEGAIAATDSLPYFKWNELPDNQNEGQLDENGKVVNADKRFWDKYRQQSKGGLYMALDKTEPLMTHFLEAQMNEKNITHEDMSLILNLDGTPKEWKNSDSENRSYVYDAQIVEGDVTCLNGYFHVLDKVLVTPPNMAEVIRTNGDTKYFSMMLDRFSAPYYDALLTEEYKALHTISADSVFQKRYISQRSQGGAALAVDPEGASLGDFPSLSYDPGWNQYTPSGSTKEQDMAVMFVPSDEAVKKYFLKGAGAMFIERYGTKPNTEENLAYNIYQIPLNIIKPLVANLMKDSFNETVPSKYLTIMNDAQDAMFVDYAADEYRKLFKKVMLANNGVVYILRDVVTPPATYSSVMAPALYSKNTQVMNTVIHADDNSVTTPSSAPLRKFYSTYLLAMQSNFSLFLPTDDGFLNYGYVDPIAMAQPNSAINLRYWTFVPSTITANASQGQYIAITAQGYRFRQNTPLAGQNGEIDRTAIADANASLSSNNNGKKKKQMLTDIMDQHIVVHETSLEGEKGFGIGHNYYLSRSGAPIYVAQQGNAQTGVGMHVKGGFQLYLDQDNFDGNEFDCVVTDSRDMTRGTNGYGNGYTYFLDRPLQPTTQNVDQVLQSTDAFSKFSEQCGELSPKNADYVALLTQLFKTDAMTTSQWSDEQNKFMIFASENDRYTTSGTSLVRFFNNYRYTIYVPSNASMEKALLSVDEGGAGLPTVASIQNYLTENTNEAGELAEGVKEKAQAMVYCMVNFYKYHFADQSVFVDNYSHSDEYQTACSDDQGNYMTLGAQQSSGHIKLTDKTGVAKNVVAPYNRMARDFELDATASAATSIQASSYVVLHSLDSYLIFDKAMANRFDSEWATVAKAKAFMKKFPLRK